MTKRTDIVRTPQSASASNKALSILGVIAAVVYGISPIDVSIDAIPVLGQLDDVSALLAAGANVVQQFSKDQNAFFTKLLKYVKWFLVAFFILFALLAGGVLAAVIALFCS